jgi:hypothetical protein
MYFTLSPFFYYAVHQDDINNYIAIETNGSHSCTLPYKKLKSIVEKYITSNGHGIDENNMEKYIVYICDKLSA